MMIALGITNGIQKEFKERLFVMNYPLTVVSYSEGITHTVVQKIQTHFPTLKLSPYYTTQVISKNEHGIQGSMVYGVDFSQEAAINKVFAKAIKGSKDSSNFFTKEFIQGIIVGVLLSVLGLLVYIKFFMP